MMKKTLFLVGCLMFSNCLFAKDNVTRQSYLNQLEFFNDSIAEMLDVLTFLDKDNADLATLKLRYYLYSKQIKRIDLQIHDRESLRDLSDTPETERHSIKKQIMKFYAMKNNLLRRCLLLVKQIKMQTDLLDDQQEN